MEVTVEERVYQGVATVWIVRNRAGERVSVYQQNVVRGAAEQFAEMGKAWVAWDPRHAVVMGDAPHSSVNTQPTEGIQDV